MSDLKNLKRSGYTTATVTYENNQTTRQRNHRVLWRGLADPWKAWEDDRENRLESSWRTPPRILSRDTKPFKVENKPVGSGSGKVQLKWKVWDKAHKLSNLQVELYSVMRAEHRYLSKGYRKIASKYFYWRDIGTRVIPVENCGVDNFFKKGNDYIVCESKFTRDESKFASWQREEKRVWDLMGKYSAGGKPCRQMSWNWIKDRARKADRRPAGVRVASPQRAAAIRAEVREMKDAVEDEEHVGRVVNIYGAEHVPIFPGRYRFHCAEGARLSRKTLHLQWTLDIQPSEFLELGDEFDRWAADNV